MAINIYGATALTGGASGALDAIDAADTDGAGTPLADGDMAYVGVAGQFMYFYIVDSSGDAENSPETIKPDANAGSFRWKRTKPFGVINSTPESGEFRIKDLRKEADGDWKIIYNDVAES